MSELQTTFSGKGRYASSNLMHIFSTRIAHFKFLPNTSSKPDFSLLCSK